MTIGEIKMEIREINVFRSISGFANQRNIIGILNIYNESPSITPPQFVAVKKEFETLRTGYYVGLCTALCDKDIERLEPLLDDMLVDGEEWSCE